MGGRVGGRVGGREGSPAVVLMVTSTGEVAVWVRAGDMALTCDGFSLGVVGATVMAAVMVGPGGGDSEARMVGTGLVNERRSGVGGLTTGTGT